MAKIEVDGVGECRVVENMGYNHNIGLYAKVVETPEGEKVAVGRLGRWRLWNARDRLSGGSRLTLTPQNREGR